MISLLINISNAKVKKINQSEEEPKYYYFFSLWVNEIIWKLIRAKNEILMRSY